MEGNEIMKKMEQIEQTALHGITGLSSLTKDLSSIETIQSIYLYGSRARGHFEERSDIDIAIVCPDANDTVWNSILQLVESASTLIKIDCVRFDNLQEENSLRQNIIKDGVILYTKGDVMIDPVLDPSIQEFFQKVEKALKALEVVVQKPMDEDRTKIDATIQRFEFTIELFWKLLKKLLFSKGVSTQYPRDILQQAYAGNLIDDKQVWLKMMNDRNQTSHTYDEDLTNQIYERIKTYTPVFSKTLLILKSNFYRS